MTAETSLRRWGACEDGGQRKASTSDAVYDTGIDKLPENYANRNDGHRSRDEEAAGSAARIIAMQIIAAFAGACLLVGTLFALG